MIYSFESLLTSNSKLIKMLKHNETFVERRKLTPIEFFIILILEDMACHGIHEGLVGYSIEMTNLGKRGLFSILKTNKERVLIGRRYPPRIRGRKK